MTPPAARLLLIGAGGAIGTAARLLIDLALVSVANLPIAVLVCNIVGSFWIGVLAVRVPPTSPWRSFWGAGVLGGFTTYSALAVGIIVMGTVNLALAVLCALVTMLLGIGACFAGMVIGKTTRPDRRSAR